MHMGYKLIKDSYMGKEFTDFREEECKENPAYLIIYRSYCENYINKIPFQIQERKVKMEAAVKNYTENSTLYRKAESEQVIDYRYIQSFIVQASDYEKILASAEMLDVNYNKGEYMFQDIPIRLAGDPKLARHLIRFLIRQYCGKLDPESKKILSNIIKKGLPQEMMLNRTVIDKSFASAISDGETYPVGTDAK